MEEDEEAATDQDMAEGSSPDYDMVRHQLPHLLCELCYMSVSPGHILLRMSINSRSLRQQHAVQYAYHFKL